MTGLSEAQLAERHRYFEQQSQEAAERLRFAIQFAQSGLQALTLINGGALVALFTFVGSATAVKFDLSAIWVAFACFAAGLVMNILAYLGAHFSQDQFYLSSQEGAWRAEQEIMGQPVTYDPVPGQRRGTLAQIAAIVAALLALISFIAGAGFALSGVLAG